MTEHVSFHPPENESIPSHEHIPSPYFKTACEAVENNPRVVAALRNIDQQGLANMRQWEFGGATFPITEVNVGDVVTAATGREFPTPATESHLAPQRTRLYVVTPGFAMPPAGHPFTPWDAVYDRVMRKIPSFANAHTHHETTPDIRVLVVGSPNSLWGRVTPEWHHRLNTQRFGAYGEAMSTFLTDYLQSNQINPDTVHITLQGFSMGGTVMESAVDRLPPQLQAHTQLLRDNSVGTYADKPSFFKSLQVAVGFGIEAVARVLLDKGMQQTMAEEPEFLNQASDILAQRGINRVKPGTPEFDQQQNTFKDDIRNLLVGMRETTFRKLGHRGRYDLTTASPKRLFSTRRFDSSSRNALEGYVGSSHMFHYFESANWQRAAKVLQSFT